MHSVYSDGSHTPEMLAKLTKRRGLDLVSVTDHDNFGGESEKRAAFAAEGVKYVTGIELSAYEKKKKIHMTGYAYDVDSPLLAEYQAERIRLADERLCDTLERLRRCKGIAITREQVCAQLYAKDVPVHTMHVVKAILAAGYYATVREVFADCFLPESPTYSYIGRLTPEEAISMIHSMGGIVCVAHPGRIDMPSEEKEREIRKLKEMGADGIECFYSAHTQEQTEYFCALADELGLLKTGGSDYHNEWGGRLPGKPAFEPSEELLCALKLRK